MSSVERLFIFFMYVPGYVKKTHCYSSFAFFSLDFGNKATWK